MECSLRRACNLTEDWLLSVVSEEQWNNDYKKILTSTFGDRERLEEQREAWGDPDEDGRGAFVLVRNEEKQPKESGFNFKPAAPPT